MVNYGGDEVSALVLDIGTSSLRAGYAGDDTPKAIIPTSYGWRSTDGDVAMSGEGTQDHAQELFIGQNGPSVWRAGMEIENPMQEGLIRDFTRIPDLIRHAFTNVMKVDPSEHPVLLTEPSWNTPANRERMAEILLEEFNVPAFYVANTGVLSAFAAGKGSALVVDVGHAMASVTPVVDGFVLRKGLMHSPLPQLVYANAKHILVAPPRSINLIPHQLIAQKNPVDIGAMPSFTVRQDRIAGTTETWKAWYEAHEVEEWVQSVVGVLDQGWNDHLAQSRPQRQYEFPSGYNTFFGPERYMVGEQFFSHKPELVIANPNLPKPIPSLINESLRQCDPDLRGVLLSNIVLTGGGSLVAGFAERLNNELSRASTQAKIHAPGNPTERRYGGWLGGSILGSLGTFHQLWISKEEWSEHGKAIVAQRCK